MLGVGEVLGILHLAEVGAVEELLEAHHLGALLGRLARVLLVLVDHRLLVAGPIGLQQGRADGSRHRFLLGQRDQRQGREMVEGADTLHPGYLPIGVVAKGVQANSRPRLISTTRMKRYAARATAEIETPKIQVTPTRARYCSTVRPESVR